MAFILLLLPPMEESTNGPPRGNVGHGRSFLIDDAAQLLGVSRRTIYYRIREGRLQTIRTLCGSQRVLLSSIESLRPRAQVVGRRPDLGHIHCRK